MSRGLHFFVKTAELGGPNGETVVLIVRLLTGRVLGAFVQDIPDGDWQHMTVNQLRFYMKAKGADPDREMERFG